MNNCLINYSSIVDKEEVSFVKEGVFSIQKNSFIIKFSNVEDKENVFFTISYINNNLKILRESSVKYTLNLQMGKNTACSIIGTNINLEFIAILKEFNYSLNDNKICVNFEYDIDYGGYTSNNKVKLNVSYK